MIPSLIGGLSMRYQNLAHIIQTGCWLLGLVLLSGCVTGQPTDAPPSLPCSVSNNAPPSVSEDEATNHNEKAMMAQALQKRLQKQERTIAAQTHQIEVLSSQLEALKQIDQETRRQPRKALTIPIP